MSIKIAEDCFVENLKLYGDPKTQAEKYNLYNGLANLAEAISDLRDDVRKIKDALSLSKLPL
jgi:hypothetical protein